MRGFSALAIDDDDRAPGGEQVRQDGAGALAGAGGGRSEEPGDPSREEFPALRVAAYRIWRRLRLLAFDEHARLKAVEGACQLELARCAVGQ